MDRYGYSVADAVVVTFGQSPKRQRDFLLRAFVQLADNPSGQPDFAEHPAGQHPVSGTRFGRWLIRWWPDHAVRVVRIIDVTLVR
jgi:hypothetical protein